MPKLNAILFDLDGTLLDTAPDLVYTLNCLRDRYHLPPVALNTMRPIANLGAKALISRSFDMKENDPRLPSLRESFLEMYDEHITHETRFFPQVEKVLLHLDEKNIPWGIVTNKLKRHTDTLFEKLNFSHRPACIVCGDTLSKNKPDPAPIQHACHLLKQEPANCVYVGDAQTDVIASKAAGTKSLVAMYGYIQTFDDPLLWEADGYLYELVELLNWLK